MNIEAIAEIETQDEDQFGRKKKWNWGNYELIMGRITLRFLWNNLVPVSTRKMKLRIFSSGTI